MDLQWQNRTMNIQIAAYVVTESWPYDADAHFQLIEVVKQVTS